MPNQADIRNLPPTTDIHPEPPKTSKNAAASRVELTPDLTPISPLGHSDLYHTDLMINILILGVLRNGPVHGYELKRRVQRPTLRPLSNNSLYPVLRRFEEQGAVTKTVEVAEGRPARNTYAITLRGVAYFHELISTLSHDEAGQEEEFLLRLGFFAEMSTDERLTLLAVRDSALEEQIAAATHLLAGVNDVQGWRARSMHHLIGRLERDREFVAELVEVVHRDGAA